MKKGVFVVAVMLSIIIITVLSTSEKTTVVNAATNLLNGGFEADDGGCPQYWSCHTYGTGGTTSRGSNSYEGNWSGKLSDQNNDSGQLFAQEVSASPGTIFEVSAWHNTNQLSTKPYIRVKYEDANGDEISHEDLYGTSGTHGWEEISGTTSPAPPGTATIQVNLTMWETSGTVLWDDVKLTIVSGSNLIYGGFEADDGGCPQYWSCHTYGTGGSTGRDTNGYLGDWSGKLSDQDTDNGQLLAQKVAGTPGATYEVSAWHHTDQVSEVPYIRVVFKDANGDEISHEDFLGTSGTHGWEKIRGTTSAAPAGTVIVQVNLTMWETSGTVLWDDARLKVVSGGNLLYGGFEVDNDNDGCAEHWSCFTYGTGGTISRSSTSYQGDWAGKLHDQNNDSGQLFAQQVDALPGTTFNVSAWHNTYQVGTDPYIRVKFEDASGNEISYEDFDGTSGSHGWEEISGTTSEAPPGTATVQVNLTMWGTSGAVLWDDVSLEIAGGGNLGDDPGGGVIDDGYDPPEPDYYIAPNGNNNNSGTSQSNAWDTFDYALSQLQPGDTLGLVNGTFTKSNSGHLYASCGNNGVVDGDSGDPITIRAVNERQAWIKGDGSEVPLRIYDCSNWNVSGVHVSSKDNSSASGAGSAIEVKRSDHVLVDRVIADHNNRYLNGGLITFSLSDHVKIQESELYYFHRNGIEGYRSEYVTVSRNYINSRGHSDISGGYTSHGISQDGGDAAVTFYYTSNSIIENTISENKNEGFTLGISGFRTNLGNLSARNNKLLGSISMNDNRTGGFGQTRIRTNNPDNSAGQPAKNLYAENYLIIDGERRGVSSRAIDGLTVKNLTAINIPAYSGSGVININGQRQVAGNTIWPSCQEIGGCSYDFSNSLFLDNDAEVISTSGSNLNWRIHHSNFWNNNGTGVNESISDGSGNLRHNSSADPSGIGLEYGQCVVFVPESSNMSGAGQNGADIGANILYRYDDGNLTNTPLWNPQTGEFPHGAIVNGLNDVDGKSAFDVNERLNVNYNGCSLPY
ncbi:hypothetical protein [Radiobacillus sp. PE A8.2]|uniref:hypothetical protein n=1 Tax=Radiobacillus sp. PE A8.2 TaxID=3380349 RepID=UPI00388FD110